MYCATCVKFKTNIFSLCSFTVFSILVFLQQSWSPFSVGGIKTFHIWRSKRTLVIVLNYGSFTTLKKKLFCPLGRRSILLYKNLTFLNKLIHKQICSLFVISYNRAVISCVLYNDWWRQHKIHYSLCLYC